MSVHIPPITENDEGNQRKVGFELEFAGLELSKTAEIIQQVFGGEIIEENRYEFKIKETELGDFRVELDARMLRKMASDNVFEKLGFDIDKNKIRNSIDDALDKMAKSVVPTEVVMPPVQIEDIEKLEHLQQELQKNKAEGTRTSFVYAFGMHINIECPDLHTETLLRYLRSFLLMYPWLLEKLDIDITRKISPFVDPFPGAYVEKILDQNYTPDRAALIEDYLQYNATRNRPLDMMPIFALIDANRVQKAMGDDKNNPRPTFHYRLPNSKIDDPGWKFSKEWNYWCYIERLADDPEMISKLCRLYLLRKGSTLVSFKKEWAETVSILMDIDE